MMISTPISRVALADSAEAKRLVGVVGLLGWFLFHHIAEEQVNLMMLGRYQLYVKLILPFMIRKYFSYFTFFQHLIYLQIIRLILV